MIEDGGTAGAENDPDPTGIPPPPRRWGHARSLSDFALPGFGSAQLLTGMVLAAIAGAALVTMMTHRKS